MAESIVKIPSAEAQGLDFLAFSFNGKHSWDDFHIYRTSDGDKYNENLTPVLQDKTAEVPGGDGMYYFGTTHKQKDFNISFAFDHLTETELKELKKWLNGKETGDLWFSEAPYKVWSAKPTGNSSIKYIPFEELDEQGNTIRIYKGEGSVQFTAYWPYAHTPDYVGNVLPSLNAHEKIIFTEQIETRYMYIESSNNVQILFLTKENKNEGFTKTVTAGKSILNFSSPYTFFGIIAYQNCNIKLWATTASTINGFNNDTNKKQLYPIGQIVNINEDGKTLDAYKSFTNNNEWSAASGLSETHNPGDNKGDLPAPFVMKAPETIDADTSPELTFKVGELEIKVQAATATKQADGSYRYTHHKSIEWDSKTGIVSAKVNEKRVVIPYTGNSLGAIPVDGIASDDIAINGGTLNYHYWYY